MRLAAMKATWQLASAVLALGLAGCKPARTQLVVHFDSDLSEQQLPDIRLRCAYDWNGRTDIDVLSCAGLWHRGSSTAEITLPASFGVLPDDARLADPVTIVLDDDQGALQRIMQVPFAVNHTAHVFVYLRASCRANVTASAAQPCPAGRSSCTLSESCEEQGLTCGDDGACRNVTLSARELILDDPDASGFPLVDAGTIVGGDAAGDAAGDVVRDAGSDAGAGNDARDSGGEGG